jgi:hypothetical protein
METKTLHAVDVIVMHVIHLCNVTYCPSVLPIYITTSVRLGNSTSLFFILLWKSFPAKEQFILHMT